LRRWVGEHCADAHGLERINIKGKLPTRNQAPPPTLNVDVYGVLFVVVAVVYVIYPLAQWALGL